TEAAAPLVRDPDLPPGARRLGTPHWRLDHYQPRIAFYGQGVPEVRVLSPDRKLLAITGRSGGAEVFDVRSGKRICLLPPDEDDTFLPLAFSHDGKTLTYPSGSYSKEVKTRSLTGDARARTFGLLSNVSSDKVQCSFLPGDERLATFDGNNLQVWDAVT